jgi:hypothetical protein
MVLYVTQNNYRGTEAQSKVLKIDGSTAVSTDSTCNTRMYSPNPSVLVLYMLDIMCAYLKQKQKTYVH